MTQSPRYWAVYEYGFVEPDWLAIICADSEEEAITKAEANYGDMAIISSFTTELETIHWLPQGCQSLLLETKGVYRCPTSPESYARWIRDMKKADKNADISDLLDICCQMANALNMAWAVLDQIVRIDIPDRKLQEDIKKAFRIVMQAQDAWVHGVANSQQCK